MAEGAGVSIIDFEVHIVVGIDPQGEPGIWLNVSTPDGDLPAYIQAIGALEMAKGSLDDIYASGSEDEDG